MREFRSSPPIAQSSDGGTLPWVLSERDDWGSLPRPSRAEQKASFLLGSAPAGLILEPCPLATPIRGIPPTGLYKSDGSGIPATTIMRRTKCANFVRLRPSLKAAMAGPFRGS